MGETTQPNEADPDESQLTVYKAVCDNDECKGIDLGPYLDRQYAESDRTAHRMWHFFNDIDGEVTVEQQQHTPGEEL